MVSTTPAYARIAARRRRESLVAYLLVAPPTLLIVGLFFLPAFQSFLRTITGESGGLTFERYQAFFTSRVALSNLWFTVTTTLTTIVFLFLICYPIALYLRFSRSRLADLVLSIALLPLFVPGIMSAYALIRFLRPRGMLETILNLVGLADYYETPYLKPLGIIIGLVWESIPFTLLVLTAGLRQIDDAVIESARDVGADNWRIFVHILLPLSRRAALIAFCLDFIGTFGAYTIPYLLGPAAPQTMGVYMQQTLQGYQQPLEAETQAIITFGICLLVGILYIRSIAATRLQGGASDE
ncbi:MAG TPA: ABC transporter permease subunit [Roseiflexaceae bacterium]|nr:ABC transporter permease subunit [Roseiflexaceae bacterium]